MLLKKHIKGLIEENGHIDIARFMAESLFNPQNGYYTKKTEFGKNGDFVTAPEISQIFGELMGIWSATIWQMIGCPKDAKIIEMGPGRGTLMKDFIRGIQNIDAFRDSISIHMAVSYTHLTLPTSPKV